MSQEALDNCEKIKKQVISQELSERFLIYPAVRRNLETVKEFYGIWYDAYIEYATQFLEYKNQSKIKPRTSNEATGLISRWATTAQSRFRYLISPQIFVEAYLIVDHFYELFAEKQLSTDQNTRRFVIQDDEEYRSQLLKEDFLKELDEMVDLPNELRMRPLISKMDELAIYRISYDVSTYDSAQTWLLLLHEAAHDLYLRQGMNLVNPFSEDKRFTEMFLDFVVQAIYGPLYALSLASYHRKYPGGKGVTHPVEPARIYALMKYSEQLKDDIIDAPLGLRSQIKLACKKLSEYYLEVRDDSRKEQNEVDGVYDKVREVVVRMLRKKNVPSFEIFMKKFNAKVGKYDPDYDTLVSMIREEIPIAADPRVLYSTMTEYGSNSTLLIRESLKRWRVKSMWIPMEKFSTGSLD